MRGAGSQKLLQTLTITLFGNYKAHFPHWSFWKHHSFLRTLLHTRYMSWSSSQPRWGCAGVFQHLPIHLLTRGPDSSTHMLRAAPSSEDKPALDRRNLRSFSALVQAPQCLVNSTSAFVPLSGWEFGFYLLPVNSAAGISVLRGLVNHQTPSSLDLCNKQLNSS